MHKRAFFKKAAISTLALIVVIATISIISRKDQITNKITKVTGEVAGAAIVGTSKFLGVSIDPATALATAPYQSVSGDVNIQGIMSATYTPAAATTIGLAINGSAGGPSTGNATIRLTGDGANADISVGRSGLTNGLANQLILRNNTHSGIAFIGNTNTTTTLSSNGYTTTSARIMGELGNMERLDLISNAAWNGTNWTLDDPAQNGTVVTLRMGMARFYTVPSGTNPRNATETMRIQADGRVGIGTAGGTAGAPLEVDGNSASGIIRIRNTLSAAGKYWQIGPDGTNNIVIYNQSGNTGAYMLDNNPSYWGFNSDQRLKTNIQALPAEKGLTAIEKLNPVTFNWIDTKSTRAPQTGFIAQDVQKVLPELVSTGPEATITLPDGSTQKIPNTLGISSTGLIPHLVKAIQEQQVEIKQLQAENAALNLRLKALEDKIH